MKQHFITFRLHTRLFSLLALGFIIATIVGTMTHEIGHYVVAGHYGYTPKLHYGSTSFVKLKPEKTAAFTALYNANKDKIESAQPSPEKTAFLKYREQLSGQLKQESFLCILAGPLQTILFGTTGCLLLWFSRKKIHTLQQLSFIQWVYVFLAFFLSRQVMGLLPKFIPTKPGQISDETKIALYYDIPNWLPRLLTGIPAVLLLCWVVLYIIPKEQRFTFILSGFIGSAAGVFIWFFTYGPLFLP